MIYSNPIEKYTLINIKIVFKTTSVYKPIKPFLNQQ